MDIPTVLIGIAITLLVLAVLFWLLIAAVVFIGAYTYEDAYDENYDEYNRRDT